MRSPRIIGALIVFLALCTSAKAADEEQGFLRFPDVANGQVIFTSEGDLWIAPLSGGIARRLTAHDGEERYAKFSPDGQWIAFSAQYDGNQDVYVIPVTGGEPKRVTYHPYGEGVVEWTKDGRIAYRTRAFSGLEDWQIYTVSAQGDFPQNLGLDKAALLSFEPNGSRAAYTQIFRNNATWKHYKGGLADQIWVADLKNKKYGKAPISTYVGHNSYPMWIGERIYFLSDSTGRKNLWSMKSDGSDQKQHTFHKNYDARWPSDGGSIIVYQLAMDLWKYDTATGKTERLNVQLPSERLYSRTRILDPSGYIDDFDLNKDGSWMVLAARGQLFTVPTKSRETVIRRLTSDFTARAKNPFYLDDQVVALTDATGEDEFFQYDPFLKDKPKPISRGNDIWRYAGRPSPDGKKVAFSDGNMTLWVMDAATGDLDKIATSKVWEIRDFSWSPDSRYLAYTNPQNQVIGTIHVYDLKDKQDHLVTDLMYNSYFPAWDPKGKFFYFLSETNFNPLPDQYGAQFVFYKTDKLYMYLLAKDARSPFAPDSSLLMPPKKEEEKKDEDKKDDKDKKGDKDEKKDEEEKKEEKVEVKIDWDGLQGRRVEIPVDPGYYYGLAAMENGLYYVSAEHVGMAPEGEPPKAALNLYKFDKRKSFTVSSGIDGFDISDDGKVVVVKKGSEFIRMDAGATEEPKGEGDEDPHVKLSGWSMTMDPRQEWRQMFREAWRIQRDFFYEPDMHGVDWPAVLKTYEPLIKRISTRDELNDLIGEMIGELNAGHAYVFGGDLHQPKSISVGLLGADISRDAASGYFRIDKIYAPDLSFKKWNSPLIASGVDAKVGDYIIAIDGTPANAVADYLMIMQDKAEKDVILTLNGKASTDGAHDALVRTISDESELRYIEWIRDRRAYVEKASGGKIGYAHFSDMSTQGLWEYGMQYYPQCDKPGMILDVRHNGGGSVATMILAQLNRKVWTVEKSRRSAIGPRPYTAFYGHYAIICDNETGSDGETFTQGAKLLELGPVFGTRTWGGWVGIRSDKPLNDKVWYTTPEFSGWGVIGDQKGHWLIEGHGVDPDYYVENDPGSVLAGKDPQLDASIEYLLKKIKDEPPELPKEPPIPKKDVNFPK
jgi:tricorn protease